MKKRKMYEITKKIINEVNNQILSNSYKTYQLSEETLMMLLVAITKFIEIKQDVIYKDKNKKQEKLSAKYPQEKLQAAVFKGQFYILDNPNQTYLRLHLEKPIKIFEINSLYQQNASWIIDNIRDSLAHNHFEIDFKNQSIHIKNTRCDRKLVCDIDFYWLIRFYYILGNNKAENNSPILKLNPFIYYETNKYQKPAASIADIEKLYDNIEIITLQIQFKENIEPAKLQKIKLSIIKEWNQISLQKNHLTVLTKLSEVTKNINTKYKNYINSMGSIKISEPKLKKQVYTKIKENLYFFKLPINTQKEIILKNIGLSIIEEDNKEEIEIGLDTIMATYFMNHEVNLAQFYADNPLEYVTNKYCYTKEKLLASLYIKGIINFVLNKEAIYDKLVDYNDFDLTAFKYYDYGKILKLKKQLVKLQEEISLKSNKIAKLSEIINKLSTTLPEKSKIKIEELNKIKIQINNCKNQIDEIEQILSKCNYDTNNNPYLLPNKQEFFTHLRNSFAHTWLTYEENSEQPLNNRHIKFEDYNDNNELVFKCLAPYQAFQNLFDNDIFLNAIIMAETQKDIANNNAIKKL